VSGRFPFSVTATVERPAGFDQHNNPLSASTHTVPDCAPAPAGSTERHHLEATVEWDLDLIGPYDADFQAEDTVTLAGDDTAYHVHGKVSRWKNPFTGWEAGSVTRLKAVRG
jgi:hypothetical protein